MKVYISISSDLSIQDFQDKVEKAYLKQFPKGWIYTKYSDKLGEYVFIVLGIQPKERHANNIEQNDPARQVFVISDIIKGKFKEKIAVDSKGSSLLVKPEEGANMVYSRVKFGFRKKTGTPESVVEHFEKYFKKMRKVVDENRDNLAHDID